jgi:tRNA(His) 5'-end guanylyltransferase
MDKTSLGDRMKSFEDVWRFSLTPRMPLIIRVDGRAFHTFTKKMRFSKPYDKCFMDAMVAAGKALFDDIQGAKLVYIQSDEISVFANDYEKLETQAWFDKNLQKIASVSASVATCAFNHYLRDNVWKPFGVKEATFDSRAFVLPKEEVCNYFIWRQKDATRNSIQGLAQSLFSHKSLHNLNCDQLQEKMFKDKGINWNNEETWKKRGVCLYGKTVQKEIDGNVCDRSELVEDFEIPIFTQDRKYVEQWV